MKQSDTAAPVVLVTGAAGKIGRTIARALGGRYRVVGIDRTPDDGAGFPIHAADFASAPSIALAIERIRREVGPRIASVIHLAAYYDMTGDDDDRYRSVNVDGTRELIRALRGLEVEQFVHASTMLVHRPCRPGERIDEESPLDPRWAYPASKAEAEDVVRGEHGAMPCVILRLAGLYSSSHAVPTLARQIARIYERDLDSYLYAGSTLVGQAMLHEDDMIDAFVRVVDARGRLAHEATLLIGEADAMGYGALQDAIGGLIHGTEEWPTLRVPKAVAAGGAWARAQFEKAVPDAVDGGEKPFVRPFMVALADDHYALDVRRARELIGWEPRHRLRDELPALIASLKQDPKRWYAHHGIPLPAWLRGAAVDGRVAEQLRVAHEAQRQREHGANRWAHCVNIGLGSWLLVQPALIGLGEPHLAATEMTLGALLMVFAAAALSWRATWARWACAAIGCAVMAAPFVLWTTSAAAYASDTLVGALVFAFAVAFKPEPGTAPTAALSGPDIPPGWSYNPSGWAQRLPVIILAVVGLYVARYLAAYQLGHIPGVWEPFFGGSASDPRNGTEEIITSHVAEAWPFPDAAIGGYAYALEILTGVVGSRRRWRTMPWLVVLFGLLIVPLSVTSIIFIVIQPVLLGTWSTLALIGAAAMLVQVPYSIDEVVATAQFMRRRMRKGQGFWRVFLRGDTDDGDESDKGDAPVAAPDEFARPLGVIARDLVGGGVGLPWSLGATALVALVLMFSQQLIGAPTMTDWHHVIGALVLTVVSIAAAEVTRAVRLLNIVLGLLLAGASVFPAGSAAEVAFGVVAGVAIAALSLRRGPIRERYGFVKPTTGQPT